MKHSLLSPRQNPESRVSVKRMAAACGISLAIATAVFASNPPPPPASCTACATCGPCNEDADCETCVPGKATPSIGGAGGGIDANAAEPDPKGDKSHDDEDEDCSIPGQTPPELDGCKPASTKVGAMVPESTGGLNLSIMLGGSRDAGCAGEKKPRGKKPWRPAHFNVGGHGSWNEGTFQRQGLLTGIKPGVESGTETSSGQEKLRWVKTARSFVYLRDLAAPNTGYDIEFYQPTQADQGNAPAAGAAPFRVVRIEKLPDVTEGTNVFKVGRMMEWGTGASARKAISQFRYRAYATGKLWELSEGTFTGDLSAPGAITLSVSTTVSSQEVSVTRYTEDRTVTDLMPAAGPQVLQIVRSTYDRMTVGGVAVQRLVSERIDPAGANLTTNYFYYTTGPEAGKIRRVHSYDGSWVHYQYLDTGWLYRTYRPFLNTAPLGDTAAVPGLSGTVVDEIVYGVDGQDRRETQLVNGLVANRVWHKKSGTAASGFVWTEIKATSPAAAVNSADNAVTVTFYYPFGSGIQPSSGKIRRVETPDGQVIQFTYEVETDGRIKETVMQGPKSGNPDGAGQYVITQGTRSTTWRLSGGQFSEEKVEELENEYFTVSHRQVIVADGFGRPTYEADQITQRVAYTGYGCCGVAWTRGYDGMITDYDRDQWGRVLVERRGYRNDDAYSNAIQVWLSETRYQRDALGRVKSESLRPVDAAGNFGAVIVESENGYDGAGRLIWTKDEGGNVTHYRDNYNSGQRVSVVSHPLSGTPANYRTERTWYYRDGRVYENAIYASGQHCGAIGGVSIPVMVNQNPTSDTDNGVLSSRVFTCSYDATGTWTHFVYDRGRGGTSTKWDRSTSDMLGRRLSTSRSGEGAATFSYYTANDSPSAGRASFLKLKQVNAPDGETVWYEYDSRGRQVFAITDVDNNVKDKEVDRVRETVYLVEEYEPEQVVRNTETWIHTAGTTRKRISQQRDFVSGLRRDTVTLGQTATWTLAYGFGGQSTESSTSSDGSSTIETYSGGRLTLVVEKDSVGTQVSTTHYNYDDRGRLKEHWDGRVGSGNKTVYEYRPNGQAAGRLWKVTAPAAGGGTVVTIMDYDAAGNETQRTLPGGKVQTWVYNALGQMVVAGGDLQYPVSYQYDDKGGRLRRMTTAQGDQAQGTTLWGYNNTGQLTAKTDDAGRSTSYAYTPGGKLQSRSWARTTVSGGSTRLQTIYRYHGFTGQVLSVDNNDNTPDVLFARNRQGQLELVQDGTLAAGGTSLTTVRYTHRYGYDANLFPQHELLPGGGLGIVSGRDAKLRLDDIRLVTGLTWSGSAWNGETADAHRIRYAFDTAGRLDRITGGDAAPDPATNWQFKRFFVPGSSLPSGTVGPVHVAETPWESARDVKDKVSNRSRAASAANTTSASGYAAAGEFSGFDYTVNDLGQRTQVERSGSAFPSANDSGTFNWLYNARGEVEAANHSANQSLNRAYSYDTIGNRRWTTSERSAVAQPLPGAGSPPVGAVTWTPNSLNQYIAISGTTPSPVHDPDGNLIEDSTRLFEWDAENRLTAVVLKNPDGPVKRIEMTYDYLSRRTTRTAKDAAGAVLSQQGWAWRGWMCLGEYRIVAGAWILERALTWGPDLSGSLQGAGGVGGLLMMEEKPGSTTGVPVGSYYPLYDGNGNITQLLDAAGSVAAHYDYDAFGNVTAATGPAAANNPWRFSTKALDPVSKFYYYGYRHYDPVTGRWPSRDPIGEKGGVNLYGMVGNNAIGEVDVLGLKDWHHLAVQQFRQHFASLGLNIDDCAFGWDLSAPDHGALHKAGWNQEWAEFWKGAQKQPWFDSDDAKDVARGQDAVIEQIKKMFADDRFSKLLKEGTASTENYKKAAKCCMSAETVQKIQKAVDQSAKGLKLGKKVPLAGKILLPFTISLTYTECCKAELSTTQMTVYVAVDAVNPYPLDALPPPSEFKDPQSDWNLNWFGVRRLWNQLFNDWDEGSNR